MRSIGAFIHLFENMFIIKFYLVDSRFLPNRGDAITRDLLLWSLSLLLRFIQLTEFIVQLCKNKPAKHYKCSYQLHANKLCKNKSGWWYLTAIPKNKMNIWPQVYTPQFYIPFVCLLWEYTWVPQSPACWKLILSLFS